MQARMNPNDVLIKQIKEISSFLKVGPFAQLPNDFLLTLLTQTD